MIRYNKLPKNIESLIPKAVDYLQARTDIHFAYLFGSLAKGKRMPLSDVDIAVYLSDDANIIDSKMDIIGKLIDLLETDEIDIVILNTAPLTLRMKILENRKVIVDNSPFIRHSYESLTMRSFFDFSVKEKGILASLQKQS